MSEEYVVECPGYFLELFKEIKPEKATREHIFCTKDVIARMVFDTPDASISVTKNLDIVRGQDSKAQGGGKGDRVDNHPRSVGDKGDSMQSS